MASILLPRVLDGGKPNLGLLGGSYIFLAVAYSFLVVTELYLLFSNRNAFCVRIRGLVVVFAATITLHIYLVLVLLIYPENGAFPCAAEYWIMSLFLPLGMALFQAANARLLKYYDSQARLIRNHTEGARKKRFSFSIKGLFSFWLSLDAARKVYVGAIAGLVLPLLPTFFLFFGSRRFHRLYGFFGPIVDTFACRHGAEWVPSILLQLFWTAVFGPYLLWKVRHIHDVHYWALQTKLAILAGLPGTPLWLAFTYAKDPTISEINKYIPTAGWFIPGLITMQQVLLAIPLWQVYQMAKAKRPTTSDSTVSKTSLSSRRLRPETSMRSLEFYIRHNIEPLVQWAASKEFTAENMVFLREVRNFKGKWEHISQPLSGAERRQRFSEASIIFFTLINPFTAEMPINIEYKIFRALQGLFSSVVFNPFDNERVSGHENVVCPWEDTSRPASVKSDISDTSVAVVPAEFDITVFDAAFESIKYLVFTNTWPRFVESDRAA